MMSGTFKLGYDEFELQKNFIKDGKKDDFDNLHKKGVKIVN
jgi:hypothetical protein